MAIPVLSVQDVANLKRMIALVGEHERKLSALLSRANLFDEPPSPEDYVVRVPTAGVAGVAQNTTGTGTGTVLEDDVAPFVACEVYQVTDGGTFLPSGFSRDAYNVTTQTVPGDSWAKISRDKFGRWAFTETNGAGGGPGALTVSDSDGAPAITGVSEIRFDETYGVVVTDLGAGIVRVHVQHAAADAVGIVNVGPQTFAGAKKFVPHTGIHPLRIAQDDADPEQIGLWGGLLGSEYQFFIDAYEEGGGTHRVRMMRLRSNETTEVFPRTEWALSFDSALLAVYQIGAVAQQAAPYGYFWCMDAAGTPKQGVEDTDSIGNVFVGGICVEVGTGSVSVDFADITGKPTDLAGYGITDAASDAELSAHASDSTAVHGITDTADLSLKSGTLAQFAATTSLELKTLISDETGSGALVFATSPTLVTPALGTPSSGVATNLTGTAAGLTAGTVTTNANLTGPITSAGNATAIASQTGTGTTFAMSASPTFTGTPAAPTATAGTDTTQIATTAFVQAAVSLAVAGLLDFKGNLDASANPNYPAASKGDTYYVSVAGKVGGASGKSVDVGDAAIASADNAGGTEASVGTSWFVLEHNVAGVLLAANNLSDLANAATARTNLGLGTAAVKDIGSSGGTVPLCSDAITWTGQPTFNNVAGVKIKDGSALQHVAIRMTDSNSASYNLDFKVNNGGRVVDLSGNLTVPIAATVSGTNTGDQSSVSGNAGTVTVVDAASDTTTWVMLARTQTGDQAPATDAGIAYNASTNLLTVNVTGNASTVTTNANLTGPVTSTGNATAIADAALGVAKIEALSALTAADVGLTDELWQYNVSAAANRSITPARLAGFSNPALFDFRLSLQSGVAFSTADQLAKGTLYLTPALNSGATVAGTGRLALYDGTRWAQYNNAEISLSLTLTSGSVYDVFVYDNAGTLTLEVLAWTNITTRATAINLQDGVPSKAGALTRRYVGTIYATATNQTEDSVKNRCVWSLYHQAPRKLEVIEATASWTYGTASWRSANNSTTNRVSAVSGLAGLNFLSLTAFLTFTGGSATVAQYRTNIGEDSVTVASAIPAGSPAANNVNFETAMAILNKNPTIGYHYYQWLENAANTVTQTVFGTSGDLRSGMTGFVMG